MTPPFVLLYERLFRRQHQIIKKREKLVVSLSRFFIMYVLIPFLPHHPVFTKTVSFLGVSADALKQAATLGSVAVFYLALPIFLGKSNATFLTRQ